PRLARHRVRAEEDGEAEARALALEEPLEGLMVGPVDQVQPALELPPRKPAREHGIAVRREAPDQAARPRRPPGAFDRVGVAIVLGSIEVDDVSARARLEHRGAVAWRILKQRIDMQIGVTRDAPRWRSRPGERFGIERESR